MNWLWSLLCVFVFYVLLFPGVVLQLPPGPDGNVGPSLNWTELPWGQIVVHGLVLSVVLVLGPKAVEWFRSPKSSFGGDYF